MPRKDFSNLNSTGWIMPRKDSSNLNSTGWIMPRKDSSNLNSTGWIMPRKDSSNLNSTGWIMPRKDSSNLNSTGWIMPRKDSSSLNSTGWIMPRKDSSNLNSTGWIMPKKDSSNLNSTGWIMPRKDSSNLNSTGWIMPRKDSSNLNSTGWIMPRKDSSNLNSTGWIMPRKDSSNLNSTGWIMPRKDSSKARQRRRIVKEYTNNERLSSTPSENPKSVGCGRHLVRAGTSFQIQTKNYPQSYPRWYRGCYWLFKATTEDTEFQLSCRDFQLPSCKKGSIRKRRRCYATNFLLLRDHSGKVIERYRESAGPKDVTIEGSTLALTLRLRAESSGFQCSVRAVPIKQEINTTGLATCEFACGAGPPAHERIVGGLISAPGRWPWVGGLVPVGTTKVFCGASLIHSSWAVTAAHCAALIKSEEADVDIILGAFDLDRPTPFQQRRRIAALHIHEDFDNLTLNNDIALLHLAYPVTVDDKVRPICLPSPNPVPEGERATVAGWGLLQEVLDGRPSSVLYEADVETAPHSSCKGIYGEKLSSSMLCAGGGLVDACKGDSGGGLMWLGPSEKWEILGVVSWGHGCGRPGFPGVYASVRKFVPWIKSFIDKSNCDFSTVPNSEPSLTTTTGPTTSASTSLSQLPKKCRCGRIYQRIVGGIETGVNEFPWQAGLVRVGGVNPFCGASIIGRRHVLTAAHCTKAIQEYEWRVEVLVGGHNTSSSSNTPLSARVPVESIIQHPNFDASTLRHDIALIQLATALDLDADPRLAPVCLPTPEKRYAGAIAVVAGWGKLGEGGVQPQSLQKVSVPVMTNEECEFPYKGAIFPESLCAGYPEGKRDACQGDSGGPLITEEGTRMVQIGVVSWGTGCARQGRPGVYTRVSKYLDWIQSVTESEDTCA
ncbi:transmembrane protease serine 9-like [Macrobrachium rosenbergii]|uniref:transmembrane protease serine 9-like n=1 Tax=Macrobrachium rosenbergii TaxID=79674 RepID=UPI0034D72B3C